jgi:hypothetical protein
MGKLTDLVSRGVRLIVAEDAATAEAPAETRPRELPNEVFDAEPPKPVEHSKLAADIADFSLVYAEAGIELPLHGYGIDKVGEMLENKRLATMAREVKATAVLAALEAAGVELKDVIQDAVRRDKSLDAFLSGKSGEVQELRKRSEARIQAVREEIEAFLRTKNTEIESLKDAVESASQALAKLDEKKRREEERLFAILGHFVEAATNPITRSAAASEKPAS